MDRVARPPRTRGARPRAPRHRARVLERPLPERDRRPARIPLGTVKTRTRSALGRLADELDGDLDDAPTSTTSSAPTSTPQERPRLERVHDLLIAAGPPPEPGSRRRAAADPPKRRGGSSPSPPPSGSRRSLSARRWSTGRAGEASTSWRPCTGHPRSTGRDRIAHRVRVDAAGNWPMEIDRARPPADASGRPFELWLTRDGGLAALCRASSRMPTAGRPCR